MHISDLFYFNLICEQIYTNVNLKITSQMKLKDCKVRQDALRMEMNYPLPDDLVLI